MLFKTNNFKNFNKIRLNGNTLHINIIPKEELFTGVEISKIIHLINFIHKKYGKLKFTIEFNFNKIQFIDKLTYVFLECICYYLIKTYHHPVQIYMNVIQDIRTAGIISSPLLLLNGTKLSSIEKFPNRFQFDIYRYHYRRLIKCPENEKSNYLGKLYEEIDRFLKPFSIDDECRDEVSLVVTELVGNACEHAITDCLIDIDVVPDVKKRNENDEIDENFFYGINIAVLNFSEKLLGDDIKLNIIHNTQFPLNERYKKIFEAYDYHEQKFDDCYIIEDFCNITTFQSKISGRKSKFNTGGTGLPMLIKSLADKSDTYRCYVISGKRCINFYNKNLEYDKDGWIGFNNDNNYFSDIPNDQVVNECLIYMPGTAYNFNFIMKGEQIYE